MISALEILIRELKYSQDMDGMNFKECSKENVIFLYKNFPKKAMRGAAIGAVVGGLISLVDPPGYELEIMASLAVIGSSLDALQFYARYVYHDARIHFNF